MPLVLTEGASLRACYGLSGTDLQHGVSGKLVALKASERAKEIEREERERRIAANQMAVLKGGA